MLLCITNNIVSFFKPMLPVYRIVRPATTKAARFVGIWKNDSSRNNKTFQGQDSEGTPITISSDQSGFYTVTDIRDTPKEYLRMRNVFQKGIYEFGDKEVWVKEVQFKIEAIPEDEQEDNCKDSDK